MILIHLDLEVIRVIEKIKNFCIKEYKVLIPVMVVGLLLIVLLFFYKEYQYDNYRNKKDEEVYQYFDEYKTEYTAQITYNLKDAIVDVKPKGIKVNYDGTPIYYQGKDKVLFPREMSIVFPLREGSQFKLYKYATYYKEDDFHYIKNNTDTGEYSVFFLYDGEGVFFFPYQVDLKVKGKVVKTLSPMSSVNIYGSSLVYFDYEEGKGYYKELEGEKVEVSSENINVSLTEKYVVSFGNEILLFGPNNLQPVFKTIDK